MAAALGLSCLAAGAQGTGNAAIGSVPVLKNWTAPNYKMTSQALVDDTFAKHPELLSLTLQGEPTGHKGIHTTFAGTFPERIGKMSSEVDVLVMTKGYTILDPRWNRQETPSKSVYLLPLRDKSGQNIGLTVIVFKGNTKSEKDYFLAASAIRDEMAAQIPNHASLFQPAAQK
ncbi:hypothetical protein ISG32_24095 [Diaphorobacter sp. NR2-3-3-1]|nr:hypothetical protein [Diaphorobacter caeni]